MECSDDPLKMIFYSKLENDLFIRVVLKNWRLKFPKIERNKEWNIDLKKNPVDI